MRVTQIIIGLSIFSLLGCNESQLGAATENEGPAGANGLTSLIKTEAELAGENCPNGGTKLMTGLDDDQSGELDEGEVDSVAYVCNGEAGPAGGPEGATGPQGEPGPQGDAGPAGDAGADGYSSLALSQDEAPGENCPNGGARLQTGLDINGDGFLGFTEVNSVSFVCNGLDGADGQDGSSGAVGAGGLAADIITVRKKARSFRYSSIAAFNDVSNGFSDIDNYEVCESSECANDIGLIENTNSDFINSLLRVSCPQGYMALHINCNGLIKGVYGPPTYQSATSTPTSLFKLESYNTRPGDFKQSSDWETSEAGSELIYDSSDVFNDGGDANGAALMLLAQGISSYPSSLMCSVPHHYYWSNQIDFPIIEPGFNMFSLRYVYGSGSSQLLPMIGLGFDIDSQLTCMRVAEE